MSRLILHAGLHRTGLRPLQQRLFHHRAALAEAGLHYPNTGVNQAHHILAGAWFPLPGLSPAQARAGAETAWQQVVGDHAKGAQTLLLSAEAFTRAHPHQIDWAELADRLRGFDEICVLVSLRHQSALLPALWLELARHQRAPFLPGFVSRGLKQGYAAGVPLDFSALLDRMDHGFSAKQRLFWDQSSFDGQPDAAWSALLELALPGRGAALAAKLPAPPNTSPSDPAPFNDEAHPLAVYTAQSLAREARAPEGLAARLAGLRALPTAGAASLLTRSEAERVASHFAPLNRAFEARLAQDQPGFRLAAPKATAKVFREDLDPRFWAGLAADLYADLPEGTLAEPDGRLRRIWRRILNTLPD